MKQGNTARSLVWDNTVTDLRGWRAELDASAGLRVVREGVSLIGEWAAISKELKLERAVVFPAPGGHAIPVVANLFADRGWVAESIGVSSDQLLVRFQEAVRHPLPWVEIASGPAQDVVHRDIDLLKLLPIPKHNELDSGPYITAGLLIARNPRSCIQNVAIHRCQIRLPDRIC